MADLDWCLCGRATFDGELYCSDNCYYVDVGVEELRPVAVIRSQRRPAAPSINKIVIAPVHRPGISPESSPAQTKPWLRRTSVESCASSFGSNPSISESPETLSSSPLGNYFAALAFKSRRSGTSL